MMFQWVVWVVVLLLVVVLATLRRRVRIAHRIIDEQVVQIGALYADADRRARIYLERQRNEGDEMTKLTALSVLPDDIGRFTSVPLGSDRVSALREEFVALRDSAILLQPELCEMSLDDVRRVTSTVRDRSQMTTVALATEIKTAALNLLTDPTGGSATATADVAYWMLAALAAKKRELQ
jgi:hypothetical protein